MFASLRDPKQITTMNSEEKRRVREKGRNLKMKMMKAGTIKSIDREGRGENTLKRNK